MRTAVTPDGGLEHVNESEFKSAVGLFCSGITVLSAWVGGEAMGLTCQAFVSHSLTPPLVSLSVSTSSRRYAEIREVDAFCVSILRSGQEQVCSTLGSYAPGVASGVDWATTSAGGPSVRDALAAIDCVREEEIVVGDHYFLVGRVVGVELGEAGEPLLYYRSGYYGREGSAPDPR